MNLIGGTKECCTILASFVDSPSIIPNALPLIPLISHPLSSYESHLSPLIYGIAVQV